MMRSVASNGHNKGWRVAETEGTEVSVIGGSIARNTIYRYGESAEIAHDKYRCTHDIPKIAVMNCEVRVRLARRTI